MRRLPGWGWLLFVSLPLLLYFTWTQLGGQAGRLSFERYNDKGDAAVATAMRPLKAHFEKTGQLAVAGQVNLPDVPKGAGIASWALRADTVLVVTLAAKVKGAPAQIKFVPLVGSAGLVGYDCFAINVVQAQLRNCPPDGIASEADVSARTQANAKAVAARVAAGTEITGTPQISGASGIGLALTVPSIVRELATCGFKCMQTISCTSARPLACTRVVATDKGPIAEMVAAADELRGDSLTKLSDAERACQAGAGPDAHIALASELPGVVKLTGTVQYWIHNDMEPSKNCWQPSG